MNIPTQDQQQERELLGNVQRNLDDDAPRLAYADWLRNQDTGDGKLAARGEFIRVQCALADPKTDTTERPTLEAREEELLKEHRKEWEQPAHWIPGVKAIRFQRGFIDGITVPVFEFVTHAKTIFDKAPTIREAHLTQCFYQDRAEALAALPELAHLTSLKVEGCGYKEVRPLTTSPYLADLRSLDLSNPPGTVDVLGSRGARALASSSYITQLTSLNLEGNQIGYQGLQALANSSYLLKLQSLDLSNNDLYDVEPLASSPSLTQLTSLNLNSNRISAVGIEALAESASLTNLRSLGLGNNNLVSGMVFLAFSPHLTRLTSLDLNGNSLDDDEVRVLAASSSLANLRSLNLSYNFIRTAGARSLASSPKLPLLTTLDLSHNDIPAAEGARILASSPHLTQLTSLDLSYNRRGEAKYEGRQALQALRSGAVAGRS